MAIKQRITFHYLNGENEFAGVAYDTRKAFVNNIKELQIPYKDDEVYIVSPAIIGDEKEAYPEFTINTLEGIKGKYQADIAPEILNGLELMLARCVMNNCFMPSMVTIQGEQINLYDNWNDWGKRSKIMNDIFCRGNTFNIAQYRNYLDAFMPENYK